jgi:hypothetical protein
MAPEMKARMARYWKFGILGGNENDQYDTNDLIHPGRCLQPYTSTGIEL